MADREPSDIRKGGYQGSADPGSPSAFTQPQLQPLESPAASGSDGDQPAESPSAGEPAESGDAAS